MTAGILGIVVAGLYIVFIYVMNHTMTSSMAIEEETGIKVIGRLKREKKNNKVIDYFMHDTSNLNCLNKMAVTIQAGNKKIKSILISGTGIGVGSTYVTTNLAYTYAKLGYKVLVIDLNKKGIQNKIFNTTLNRGFSDLLLRTRNTTIENINMEAYIANTPIDGVNVLAFGEEKLNERMLMSENMTQVFNHLASRYDIILIDTPSMKKDVTALILSTFADFCVTVAEYGKTKLDDIEEAKESLHNIEQEVNGIILNKIED